MSTIIFTVEPPFTPPRPGALGTDNRGRQWRAIRAQANPSLGPPLFAAFIPVRKQDDRWVPVGPGGPVDSVLDVGWVQAADPDDQLLFTIKAPAEGWRPPADGVLMVLVYDQPGSSPTFPQDYSTQAQYQSLRKGLVPAEPTPIRDLDPSIGPDTQARIDGLLRGKPAGKLSRAVISPP